MKFYCWSDFQALHKGDGGETEGSKAELYFLLDVETLLSMHIIEPLY